MIGDEARENIVMAVGIREGERWAMTVDRYGIVGLWPEGAWGEPWDSRLDDERAAMRAFRAKRIE